MILKLKISLNCCLEKMESFYLPGFRNSRRAQSDGKPQPDFLGGS